MREFLRDDRRERAAGWLLLALAIALWFGTLGYRHLIHPDEGRYAEIAREMLASGDWVTPRLNGILYFEKPALQYWTSAAAFGALGVNEFAARLWPALTGAFAVLALWWVARRLLGPRAALYAACVLGSSAWWIANGHFLNLDMGLSAFLTTALVGFCYAQRDEASARQTRAGMLVVWASMALAVLSKGLIGVVLPGGALVLYSIAARDFVVWRRMHWVKGLALFFAIAAPWFVLVSLRNPEFAKFFFIHEHFDRFFTTTHRRTGSWHYFVDDLLAGLLPWTTLLPGALVAGWRRDPGRFQLNRLLVVWAAFIFVFFSASSSKLPSYILPMFPALALLVAQRLEALPVRRIATHAAAMLALSVTVVLVVAALPQYLGKGSSAPMAADFRYGEWIVVGAGIVGIGCALAMRLARTGRKVATVLALTFGALVGTQVVLLGHQSYATLKSARTLVEAIGAQASADAPFYSVETYDQTLPFYLRRPVTLVAWVDEFETGIRIEPERQIPTLEQFRKQWFDASDATAVMQLERFEDYEREGLPMWVIYRDARRVVVVRR